MGNGRNRAFIETNLARAHRAVYSAKKAAEQEGDDVLWLDLEMIEVTLTRLAEASLRGRAKNQIAGQLQIKSA